MLSISRNIQWRWWVSAKTDLQQSTFLNAEGHVVITGLDTDIVHGLRQGIGRNRYFVWAGLANSDIVYIFPAKGEVMGDIIHHRQKDNWAYFGALRLYKAALRVVTLSRNT